MTSDQKINKLLCILKICFHSYMPVLPYLSFLSFPSRLFFIQPPTTLLWILPESVLSATQLRRDPVVKITDVFPSFLPFRWDGLTTPCCPFLPPPSASPISLNPLPLIHLLPTCRALILALHICRSYCAAINDCNAIMGKWSCLCNPLTMSWEWEGKKNTWLWQREFQKALSFTTVFFLSLLQTSVSEARQAMRGFHSNGAQITLIANM